jgi:hypothetical protein
MFERVEMAIPLGKGRFSRLGGVAGKQGSGSKYGQGYGFEEFFHGWLMFGVNKGNRKITNIIRVARLGP